MQYQAERGRLWTESGAGYILEIQQSARHFIETSGAVLSSRLITGDSFMSLNAMDYLEEQGYLRQVTGSEVAGQDRVYVAGPKFRRS